MADHELTHIVQIINHVFILLAIIFDIHWWLGLFVKRISWWNIRYIYFWYFFIYLTQNFLDCCFFDQLLAIIFNFGPTISTQIIFCCLKMLFNINVFYWLQITDNLFILYLIFWKSLLVFFYFLDDLAVAILFVALLKSAFEAKWLWIVGVMYWITVWIIVVMCWMGLWVF